MIEVAIKCPCGTHAVVDTTDAYSANDRWSCHCPSCLDPTEDGGERSHLQGYGRTPEDAIADWWHRCEEAWEIDYTPNALFAAISEQAGDEAKRQSGWSTRRMLMPPNEIVFSSGTSNLHIHGPREVSP